jgi:hypothetical protein
MNKKITDQVYEYAVRYLHDTLQMNPKNICKELGLTQKRVDGILNIKKNDNIPVSTSSTDNEMIINKTQSNRKGVSIMTQAASTKADEVTKGMNNVVSRTAKNAIFRPRGN